MSKLIFSTICWLLLSSALWADPSSAAKGVIILTSASGSDPRNVLFSDLIWTDFNGGTVIATDGQKSRFDDGDIGKIVYFDAEYYNRLDHNGQTMAFRAISKPREEIINTSFFSLFASSGLKSLQASESKLEFIEHQYPSVQALIQPQLDLLKDDINKLTSGQSLMNGKWMSQQDLAAQTNAPVVGEAHKPVSFTTKNGKKYVNVTVTPTDTGLSVLTSDGGGTVPFDQLPDDLSVFPDYVRKIISGKQTTLANKGDDVSTPVIPTRADTQASSGNGTRSQADMVQQLNRAMGGHHMPPGVASQLAAQLHPTNTSEANEDSQKWVVLEKPVAQMDSSMMRDTFKVSPDSRRMACAAVVGDKWFAVVDGQEGKRYDGIGNICFSPDSKRVAYAAHEGDKWLSVVDEKEDKPYDGIVAGTPIFSPDSKRVAYAAQVGEKWLVLVDGKEDKLYDGIGAGSLCFSLDNKRVAYAAHEGDKWLVIVNGQEGKRYDGTGDICFSPDSKRVAYVAHVGDKWFTVVDGREEKTYESIGSGSLSFSFDSKRIIYVAQVGNKQFAVVDGQEGKRYDGIGNICFSPDSKRVAYAAHEGDKWLSVVDEKEDKPYDGIGNLSFSPDSKRVAYVAHEGDKWLSVVDGQEGKRYDGTGSLCFSPDSKRVAYAAQASNNQFAVLDGKEDKPYDNIVAGTLSFSPDSKRLVYDAHAGNKEFVVVDRKEERPYDMIFTIGGGNILFDSADSFHYLAVNGNGISLISETPSDSPTSTSLVNIFTNIATTQNDASAPIRATVPGPQEPLPADLEEARAFIERQLGQSDIGSVMPVGEKPTVRIEKETGHIYINNYLGSQDTLLESLDSNSIVEKTDSSGVAFVIYTKDHERTVKYPFLGSGRFDHIELRGEVPQEERVAKAFSYLINSYAVNLNGGAEKADESDLRATLCKELRSALLSSSADRFSVSYDKTTEAVTYNYVEQGAYSEITIPIKKVDPQGIKWEQSGLNRSKLLLVTIDDEKVIRQEQNYVSKDHYLLNSLQINFPTQKDASDFADTITQLCKELGWQPSKF